MSLQSRSVTASRWALRWAPLSALLCLACETLPTPLSVDLNGARFLAFRCVDGAEADDEAPAGFPLDGCGCARREATPEGEVLRQMGRVECDCVVLNEAGESVEVEAIALDPDSCEPVEEGGCVVNWICDARRDDRSGDWVPTTPTEVTLSPVEGCPPAPPRPTSARCRPQRRGEVRGYVGSVARGEVSVMNLQEDTIRDLDPTTPGVNAIFIDDLISDVAAHPDGAFVFTLNSSAGALSVIYDDLALRPALTVPLESGPLLQAIVWPKPDRLAPTLSAQPRAFISAPLRGVVLEIDLDALGRGEDPVIGALEIPRSGAVCGACGAGERCEGEACVVVPGRLAISDEGDRLFVAHGGAPAVTIFDLVSDRAPVTINLSLAAPCDDGYLTRLITPKGDEPPCLQASECEDGADNDGDGLIDADDPDCGGCLALNQGCGGFPWEGPRPACDDGVDNDGDGRVDRADPGCAHEADDDERDGFERDAACQDGLDNDGDGLIDALDPGCVDDRAFERYSFERYGQCADGIDNDLDGAVDFPDDPDCYAAADPYEAGAAVAVGPSDLQTLRVDEGGVSRDHLLIADPNAGLLRVALDDLSVARVPLDARVMSMATRRRDGDSSVIVITDDGLLRVIDAAPPAPLLSDAGREVFAHVINAPIEGCSIPAARGPVEGDAFALEGDLDGDGLLNPEDNCPSASNPGQEDEDADGIGDVCEAEICIGGFYVVRDGTAWGVTGMEMYTGGHRGAWPLLIAPEAAPQETTTPFDLMGEGYTIEAGRADPMVYAAPRALAFEEANLRRSAYGYTPRALTAPQLFYQNTAARFDPQRYPAFCRLDEQTGEPDASCIPVSYTPDGRLDDPEALRLRSRARVAGAEGIEVHGDRDALITGRWHLTFEGELPGTESRTGQFGARQDDDAWTLLDYHADFCERGVEVGDVLLVEVFVPLSAAAGAIPECRALRDAAQGVGAAAGLREPLRYRIAAVSAHQLDLVRDPREGYAPQVSKDERSTLPSLAAAPPAPLADCAAQFIYYRVRAGDEAWLLTSEAKGYRHPWINQGGQCALSSSRLAAKRVGRVHLDEPFEGEFFRFKIGAFRHDLCDALSCLQDLGVPDGALPYMIDARFQFDIGGGVERRRLADVAILPQEMRWLPNDDRLYVVDNGYQTVVKLAGLDVLRGGLLRIVQRYK
ncbi:hypothetical protein KKF91_07100 [Myxococcota bacterium]|nr:hypothetical protein [Myxococcota bacterium]MBU1900597.1 hypothetical protein [Myxococcota bacterium]